MTSALRIRRRLWVALAAVAAAVSMTARASPAVRCEAGPEGCAARCYEAGPATAPSLPTTQALPVHGPAVGRPVPSTTPCGCCAQAPTAPAPKPGQRTEARRAEPGRELAAAFSQEIRPRRPSTIAFTPDVGPSPS